MMITIELNAVIGGVVLGLAAGMMFIINGTILGCSGILFRSLDLSKYRANINNGLFLLGLFISGVLFNYLHPTANPAAIFKTHPSLLVVGGIFIGGGTYLSNGCTSGHGLCGLSLLRKRSIIAVSIFFPVAIITSWLIH